MNKARFRNAKEAEQTHKQAKMSEKVKLHLPRLSIDGLTKVAKELGVSLNSLINVLLWVGLQEEKDKLSGTRIPKDVTLHKVLISLEWTRHDNCQTETSVQTLIGPFEDYIEIDKGEYINREYTFKFKARRNP